MRLSAKFHVPFESARSGCNHGGPVLGFGGYCALARRRMCGTENERVMIPHKKEERTASKEAVRSRPATISRNINFV